MQVAYPTHCNNVKDKTEEQQKSLEKEFAKTLF